MHFDLLGDAYLATEQAPNFRFKRACERVGEGRQEYTRIGIGARKIGGSVERDDSFTRTCRTGNLGGTIIIPFRPVFGVVSSILD